jgi:hypothetical protein
VPDATTNVVLYGGAHIKEAPLTMQIQHNSQEVLPMEMRAQQLLMKLPIEPTTQQFHRVRRQIYS